MVLKKLILSLFFFLLLTPLAQSISFDEVDIECSEDGFALECEGTVGDILDYAVPVVEVNLSQNTDVEDQAFLYDEGSDLQAIHELSDNGITHEFRPSGPLGDGEYTFFMNATNQLGNTLLFEIYFEIDADQMNIWVEEPKSDIVERPDFAASTQETFDLVLGAERKPLECGYLAHGTSADSLEDAFDSTVGDFDINASDNITKQDFDMNSFVRNYEEGRTYEMSVVCREEDELGDDLYSAQIIQIGVFQNPPDLLSATQNPAMENITDPTNRDASLSLETDQEAFCYLENTNTVEGNSIEFERTEGVEATAANFTSLYEEEITFPMVTEQLALYEVEAECHNKAGLYEIHSFTLGSNLTEHQDVSLRQGSPPEYTRESTVDVIVDTVFDTSECTFNVDGGEEIDLESEEDGRTHTAEHSLDEEGTYVFEATCGDLSSSREVTYSTAGPDNTEIEIIDSVVEDGDEYVCSANTMTFEVTADEGELNIEYYDYEVSGPENSIVDVSQDGIVTISLLDLGDEEDLYGSTVRVSATPMDLAGNPGPEAVEEVIVERPSSRVCSDAVGPMDIEILNPDNDGFDNALGREMDYEVEFGFSYETEHCNIGPAQGVDEDTDLEELYDGFQAFNHEVDISESGDTGSLELDLEEFQTGFQPPNHIRTEIVCQDEGGDWSALPFYIGVYDEPVDITDILQDPDVLQSFQFRDVFLNHSTTDLAFCTYEPEEELDTNFNLRPIMIAEQFSDFKQNHSDQAELPSRSGPQEYPVELTCKGPSGLESSATFELESDISEAQSIDIITDEYTNQQNPEVEIDVQRDDFCTFELNDELQEEFSIVAGVPESFETNDNLQSGWNNISVSCNLLSTPERKQVFYDTERPGDTNISSMDYTCSLTEFDVEFEAEDHEDGSGIGEYHYNATIDGEEFGYHAGSTTRTATIQLRDIGSEEDLINETVSLTAYAVDRAGNEGRETSRSVDVEEEDFTACDTDPPFLDYEEEYDEDSSEYYVTLTCADDHSGCVGINYNTLYNISASCDFDGISQGITASSASNVMNETLTVSETSKLCYVAEDKAGNIATGSQILEPEYPVQCYDEEGELDPNQCGGDCQPCEAGSSCEVDSDCQSGICEDNQCVEATCDDGLASGEQTDVDCGGPNCPSCEVGSSCDIDNDCVSGVCEDNQCVEATCDDGLASGEQTDVDCGGPNCPTCPKGDRCELDTDCEGDLECNDGICGDPREEEPAVVEEEEDGFLGLVFLILSFVFIAVGGGLLYYDFEERKKAPSGKGQGSKRTPTPPGQRGSAPLPQREQKGTSVRSVSEDPETLKKKKEKYMKSMNEKVDRRKKLFSQFEDSKFDSKPNKVVNKESGNQKEKGDQGKEDDGSKGIFKNSEMEKFNEPNKKEKVSSKSKDYKESPNDKKTEDKKSEDGKYVEIKEEDDPFKKLKKYTDKNDKK